MRVTAITILSLTLAAAPLPCQEADLIIAGGRVWTADSSRPWVEAVAVRGEHVLAVGDRDAVLAHRARHTRLLEVPGRFVMPGFIDNHTHFSQAGALLLGVNLLDVSDDGALVRRVREARDRLPAGAWLLGGEWGAYARWAQGATGREGAAPATPVGQGAAWRPHRSTIDSITPSTPALLNRWDRGEYLANRRALALAGIGCETPGVECDRGVPTGRLTPDAAAIVRRAIPEKTMEQRLAEARAALAELRRYGVTTIHDNTSPEQIAVYQALHSRGELTVRVYARPTLDRWRDVPAMGLPRSGAAPSSLLHPPSYGDEWIRIGGLKGFVDGIMGNSSARFYEPYLTSGERGQWRTMVTTGPGMQALLLGADSAGWWPQVHAIGDEAIDTLLTMFERVIAVNPPRERRFRVIHTQVLRGPEVAHRMRRLGVIAEVQPYHAIDDMRWMEQRIGARSRWAYAFRTLRDAGVPLSFGSDWPGTNASWYTCDPLKGVYAAVTRQTLDGLPAEGWFPEERVDVETALRAYTVVNAWVAGEERLKGRLAPGLLADIVILDADPFAVPPSRLRELRVLTTMVGGRIVHEGN